MRLVGGAMTFPVQVGSNNSLERSEAAICQVEA